ncbi:serine/threonine protein kinase [Calothrix sp. FACHB-1219]|uniref:serine/threonine-protein kinase n=1 Tax=unclassified Calothrix TaxID=2619626 RepID=UPI001684FFA2|nr:MULTISPECIES: serine/threonine-protein kinase [unclassified Calothrix]MBD2206291.1 serine/threonine protein kinase [Calothrix sp. FACHB-168]MBD2221073.1 serine/threonine protein kinase [Calothrix sp. FACHB-1219]
MQVFCTKNHVNNGSNRFCTHCGEPLPLPVGQLVDKRYKIIRQLGQGGFGRTYLAEDKNQANKQCVLKEFAPQVQDPQDLQKAKELFEREAKTLKKLQHPQIPKFHASLQEKLGGKDFFFLVQDYIDGDNYRQLLEQRQSQKQTFSEEEVLTLLEKILPVLAYLHSQDVVHRDISPDNLIWRRSDSLPVLIDFGGVKQLPASQGFWFTQLAVHNTLLGKTGYAPEEQLRQGKVYFSSDLYSLAVTALVLLTGKEPQALYDSYQGIWLWGKEIKLSPKLEAVFKKMLAYQPNARYQNANQVLKDLPTKGATVAAKPQNPQITKLKTMIVAPGGKQTRQVISKIHQKTQLIANKMPLPVWMRPFAVSMLGTSVIVLIVAGSFAAVNAIIRGVSSISLPTLPTVSNPIGKPVNDKSNQQPGRLSQIISRRQQLEIPEAYFIRMVDNLFYAQKPELQRRALTGKSEDAPLRDEWAGIAENLLQKLEQAQLSSPARRKLGSYSQKDFDRWREQAKAGQFGDYTLKELTKDTNTQFDRLFPGKQGERSNLQTYGQIWYAIAADRVSKVQSGN